MRKTALLAALFAALSISLGAQNPARGYYKDVYMDSGIMLTSRTDLPVTNLLGLSMEAFVSTKHSYTDPYKFTQADTLIQRALICGSPEDENGILLYPDGAPRFRMIYMNGGRAGTHGKSLEEKGRQHYRDFVNAGGSYLGSCAGAFVASRGVLYADGKVKHTASYLNLWPGCTISTKLEKSYTAVDIVNGSPLEARFSFDGKTHIDSVRHNGGCYADLASAPKGTEVLARYDTKGRQLEKDIDGQPVIWAYKASDKTGRVILCGSHPEGAYEDDNLALMAAMVRYALDGNAGPVVKAALKPGEVREMTAKTSEGKPEWTRIGDRQFHHFTIQVPKGTRKMVVDLQGILGSKDFDLSLFARRGGFAFGDNSPYCAIGATTDKTLTIKDPTPGKYYISVFCETTVESRNGKYGVEYSGRTDVLNGVPYTLKVSFE